VLLKRAEEFTQEQQDRDAEIKHVHEALRANDYEPWILELPKARPPRPPSERGQGRNDRSKNLPLPYIKGTSEPVARILKKYGIHTYHKPYNTIREKLVHPKDKPPKWKKCGVVYKITCQTCQQCYIGETGRPLGKRIEEHKKLTSSAIHEHMTNTGHLIDLITRLS